MRDKFEFSNAQALGALTSTGVVSTNVWDIEEGAVTDGQVYGWLNLVILSTTNTGCDSGIRVELRCDDTAALSHAGGTADEKTLGVIFIQQAEIVAGKTFCIGVNKMALGTHVGVWYEPVSEAMDNATAVDCWFSEQPISDLGVQKKPS